MPIELTASEKWTIELVKNQPQVKSILEKLRAEVNSCHSSWEVIKVYDEFIALFVCE